MNNNGSATRFFWGYTIILLLNTLLNGCATLPDTSGYTAATIQVKHAVAATGIVIESELKSAIEAKATTADHKTVEQFKLAWAGTLKSLDGMVEYAQSIEQIVRAGDRGAESAMQVADSVKSLAEAVDIDPVSGASATLVKLSLETIAFVNGEYSKHVAAKSLEKALNRFGPSMTQINILVQQQISDARDLFAQQIETQIQELMSGSSGYGNWIKREKKINEKTQIAVTALIQAMEDRNADQLTQAKAMIAQAAIGRNAVSPHLSEYHTKVNTIRQREKAGLSILDASENAIAAWDSVYQDLSKAIKERKPVSVESLTVAVSEIRTLTQRWREL